MSAEENKEIHKAIEELDKLSQDPKEREKYEEREWSIMRYNAEMETNREIGEKNKAIEIAKKLYKTGMPIKQISEIVGLSVSDMKNILSGSK